MFEYYNVNNKIIEDRYLEMHDILKNDFINRKGIEKYDKLSFSKDSFNKWVNMIRNDENYNIQLYIINNKIAGFICYMFIGDDLCLCEVQIKKMYQGKCGILKKMINQLLQINRKKSICKIIATIDKDNIKSRSVFQHIGMVNTHQNWYEIDYSRLFKWSQIKKIN